MKRRATAQTASAASLHSAAADRAAEISILVDMLRRERHEEQFAVVLTMALDRISALAGETISELDEVRA